MGREPAPRSRSERDPQWFLLQLAACHKGGPPAIMSYPMLFNIFIRDLDDRIKSTLTRFADGGQLDTSEGRAILKRDLDRLEKWASKNCMKLKGRARSCTWDEIPKEASTGWDLCG